MQKTLILALASLPTIAAAQSFEGAVGDLQFQKYDAGPSEVDSLEGYLDAAWGFGMMGAQVGLTLGKEIDSSDDIDFQQFNGLTAHVTADVSDSLRLGAMLTTNNQTSGIALYAAEALYLAGPLRVEGRLGDSLDSDDVSLFEVKGSYGIGSAFSARGGYHYTDYGSGDGHYRVISLGAGYRLGDSMELYADLSRHKTDTGASEVSGDILNLGVRFDLGGDGERLFSYQPLN